MSKASVVGSIGVIMGGFGFHELISRHGVERRLMTAGEKKALMDPFSPVKEEEKAVVRETLEEIHEVFKEHVRQSRYTSSVRKIKIVLPLVEKWQEEMSSSVKEQENRQECGESIDYG